jgi:hypothetical protein
MLLMGSKALLCFDKSYICPDVKRHWDTDIICTPEEYAEFERSFSGEKEIKQNPNGKNIAILSREKGIFDFELALPDSTGLSLMNLVKECGLGKIVDKKLDMWAVNPDVVFALKKSHRFLKDSPHFMKTMLDFRYLRDVKNCKVPDALHDWYTQRTKSTYFYKHPNLNVTKADFFKDDGIKYVYDHDSIHEAIKNLEHPAYWYFKEEKAEVKCSKKIFDEQTEEVKLYSVLEETCVLALERSQIPNRYKPVWSPKKSFDFALFKLCTSISSGWWRSYAYENYFKIKSLYDPNYTKIFFEKADAGLVKPYIKTTNQIY